MRCPYCGEELETKSNKKGDLGFFCTRPNCEAGPWWIEAD